MRSKAFLFASAVLCASNAPAHAISWNVQLNCASDYYAYCAQHTAGSAACHACMRANRTKLSNSCVNALIDDGVLPKADAARQKAKIATAKTKAKPPQRSTVRLAAKPAAKAPSEKVAAVRPTPEAASSAAETVPASPPETVSRAPDPTPSQQPEPPAATPHQVEAAPGIDHQTFEALKNRAPYFVETPEAEIGRRFDETAANTAPQSPSAPH